MEEEHEHCECVEEILSRVEDALTALDAGDPEKASAILDGLLAGEEA